MAARGYTYKNFDIRFEESGGEYVAFASVNLSPASGPATARFTLDAFQSDPYTSGPAGDSVQPSTSSRGLRPAWPQPVSAMDRQALGRLLYARVFGDGEQLTEVGKLLEPCCKDLLAAEGQGLRLRLNFAQAPSLAVLPWEYLCASGQRQEAFALSNRTPVVRLGAGAAASALVQRPLRVLGILSKASGDLDLAEEWDRLSAALDRLRRLGYVELESLEPPTLDGLQNALRSGYHVIHFMGHGRFDAATNKAAVLLDKETSAENLALHLGEHPPLLVFLNACESAKGSSRDALAGMAQSLIDKRVPEVIAMQFSIGDKAAIRLAQEFYEAVADGYPVEAALAEARRALYTSEQQSEWGTPVLFTCCSDSLALDVAESRKLYERRFADEPETVLIPAGRFWFGSAARQDQELGRACPPRRLLLPAYAIGRHAVTNREYARFLTDKRENQIRKPRDAGWSYITPPVGAEQAPVVGITWDDACAYCEWLSCSTGQTYRLPTESEWEKAARGDQDQRIYPWGNDPAGEGTSPYGCHDMVGKIYEWTCTVWGGDPTAVYSSRDTEIRAGASRANLYDDAVTLRAGPFKGDRTNVSCSMRFRRPGLRESPSVGFRVVRAVA